VAKRGDENSRTKRKRICIFRLDHLSFIRIGRVKILRFEKMAYFPLFGGMFRKVETGIESCAGISQFVAPPNLGNGEVFIKHPLPHKQPL